MTTIQVLLTIMIMAAVTLLTRAFPFLVFPENKKTPEFVLYLGKVLPFAIIGMLVIYCFKSVSLFQAPFALPELIAAVFVIAIHKWKHNLLLSIGGGTVLYMFLVQVVFG
ncbi:MAG: AzlD domain-containing protein [Lachnospiraceae bacterium]|nr:AzlD domain-containing protein [Lachnospiraceae bacterium]